ncbi:MAG TPA: malto-oligosyltrehalose trehalohydrolase [Gemmatimonadaceae bacterium]|nr:malto-oligosyltrehalose trehalohydrolase [Gemmatimonadaceae bacterium]
MRRYPIGVEVVPHSESEPAVHARVWAPAARTVELVSEDPNSGPAAFPLEPEGNGYFSALVPGLGAGSLYRYRLDGREAFPDPASRFQPSGPHGASMIMDPTGYRWTDHGWPGVSIDGQVIYEIHIGTFTKAGTYKAAIDRLPELVDLGVTVIEVMPLADFVGNFGWGYDGVNLFAPTRLYGSPDELRGFVDAAHRLELGVILDVVYNHFGPDGNYVMKYSPRYFSGNHTEWGDALNFDGDDSRPVREFFATNARYWIDEFHFDGLRFDATQQIFDSSTPNIMTELVAAAREAAGARKTIFVAENEPQRASLVRPTDAGGSALDGLWNDDFHHSARVALTGRAEAYYEGYRGSPQEFVSAAKYGFLYQGQWYEWQHHQRGTPALDVPPKRFVTFIQNHDQVANTAGGRRVHQETSPGRLRAMTALLLLAPQTPMLFQGQEFAASAPFLYFADHTAELATLVREGRTKFVSQFPSAASDEGRALVPDPADSWTFVRCKLDWSERRTHAAVLALHRDLIRLRREDSVLRAQRPRALDGAVLTDHAFLLRFFGDGEGDRLLIVNLGGRVRAEPLAEPLAAPPLHSRWTTIFSTESPAYGGAGTPAVDTDDGAWRIPAECALLLSSKP